MGNERLILREIFAELDRAISEENVCKLKANEIGMIPRAKVTLLGQMSLLANEAVSVRLTLARTADLDAKITMEDFAKRKLLEILRKHRLFYDEDSPLIWIPEDAKFDELIALDSVFVEVIDPESALVSKAVKAKEKNKQLIREAIASKMFPQLVSRIIKSGVDLEFFT